MEPEPVTLLLIEDDPADARLLAEILRDVGPSLIEPHLLVEQTLRAGRERISGGGVDVVLLDLTLPDSTGLDTFHALAQTASQLPILILSGLDDQELAIAAVQAGAQDYLVKGRINGAALTRAVRYAIERKRAQLAQEALLLRQSRLEGVLLAAREMAHRINNDVQLAVGSLSILEESETVPPELRALIGTALERVLGLAEHVQQLQHVIRVETRSTPAGLSLDLARSLDRSAGE
ncbi:MAG: response regulator [Chloroflexota bacterium]|nr:response regulator [Dehalococcoidia bacterium]MDW8253041.1 response regulator [Chloroflexota bacterium]